MNNTPLVNEINANFPGFGITEIFVVNGDVHITSNYDLPANLIDTIELVAKLNAKYPAVTASVNVSPWGGRLEIEVATVDKAKALRELFPGYTFTSGMYK